MMTEHDPEKLLTPAEVAKRLGVSPITVRSWVSKGWLVSQATPGGHRRFLWKDVERLIAEKRQTTSVPDSRKASAGNPVRILVVDDDQQFRTYLLDAIDTILPEAIVRAAEDGFQAGMILAELRPQLVLLDYSMPSLNGAAVCALIRSNHDYDETRIVAVTGFANAETRDALMLAGADRVLSKPLPLDTLREILGKFEPALSA